jgi:glycosyltransferase involved in cell wall biosynthesis
MKKDKLLFAYNGRVDTDPAGNYFGNELNDTLVERYRILGNHVSFLVRTRKISTEESGKVLPFKSKNFCIIPIPDFNSLFKYFSNFKGIRGIVKGAVSDADILVARLPSTVGRIAIDYAKKNNKPYLVEVVGCPWDALWNHSLIGKLLAPIAWVQMRRYVAEAPFVIYVTKSFLQQRYPSKHIHEGISDVIITETNHEVLENRLKRIRENSGKKTLVIGTVAALDVTYKGQDIVISAVKLLKEAGWSVKYKLVGKGSGKRLKNLAKELDVSNNVEFIGQIPHHAVFPFLDSIDLYIQPSLQEGLPRAMIEAMSRACPCIGANTGGIPELIAPEMVFHARKAGNLISIIKNMNENTFIACAKLNFEKAQSFLPVDLDGRRRRFYHNFLQQIAYP